MNPIFNTKNMFYDYFPHLPAIRMKNDFGLGFYEQSVIRNEIQKAIRKKYEHLLVGRNLVHVNVYAEIGDEYDEKFYRDLKENLKRYFHETRSWSFLNNLLKKDVIEDQDTATKFNTKIQAALGWGMRRDRAGKIHLKDALVAILNLDLDALNGRELLYLIKLK